MGKDKIAMESRVSIPIYLLQSKRYGSISSSFPSLPYVLWLNKCVAR